MIDNLAPTVTYTLNAEDLENVLQKLIDAAIEEHFDKQKADKMLSIAQVCKMLDVDKSTLWHWNKDGYLKKIYVGSKPRYKESDVKAILEGRA